MSWRWKTAQVEHPPVGSHIARCIALIDLGTQQHPGFKGGSPWAARDVRIGFELPNALMAGRYKPELKGKAFRVSTTVKQSLHPSAKLRKMLKSWKGRDFTKEELENFDPKQIVGRACRLTLVESNDFVNIDGVAPLSAGEKCPKQVYASTLLSLELDDFDQKVYDGLPEQLRNKIALSPEFKLLVGGGTDEPEYGGGDESEPEPGDDNIPF